MIGIVVVSHSAQVAEGAVALARQMASDEVRLEAAGGSDETEDGIGTDAMKVMQAIETAGADGADVLVLMDLGSAVLSTETAMGLIDPELAERVRLSSAPIVEGAVAAAVTASGGATIDAVAEEARRGLVPKQSELGDAESTGPVDAGSDTDDGGEWHEAELDVDNANGLHARPAARFVQIAGGFDARVEATNITTGAGPARASSLTDVATLGARQGHRVRVRAQGPQAAEAIAALRELADDNFGDVDAPTPAPAPATPGPAASRQMAPVGMSSGDPMGGFQIGPDGSFMGLAAAPGRVVASARRLVRPPATGPREQGDPAAEAAAFDAALDRSRSAVRFARDSLAAQAGEDHAAMLDAQLAMLDDHALIDPTLEAITAGTRAEDAWTASVDAVAARFLALDDEYLRARAEDVREIGRRVLQDFTGGSAGRPRLRGPGVLIARELGAAETAVLDLSLVKGIAVATGSPTSHSAILARALGVPAVVGLGEVLMSIGDDTPVLLDGDAGTLRVGPDPETVARVRAEEEERARVAERARTAAAGPAETKDGVVIEVAANIAAPTDAADAVAAGADGVGLFRTEFLYMNRDAPPDEDEQETAYRQAAEAMEGRRLVIRTMDIGGDKPVAGVGVEHEDNPFLGQRGIRLSLAHPDLLRTQLRAILRVAADHRIGVMFPMIADDRELIAARAALDEARSELVAAGHAAGDPEVGVMIEVPSAALCADALAEHVDFFSIGTNDLTQYTLAAERGNTAVADLGDPYHPAVLRLIGLVCASASRHDRWVGVCGEAAANVQGVKALIGLGVRELSVAAPRIGEVKAEVRDLDADAAAMFASGLLRQPTLESVHRSLAGEGCGGNCEDCDNHCH